MVTRCHRPHDETDPLRLFDGDDHVIDDIDSDDDDDSEDDGIGRAFARQS